MGFSMQGMVFGGAVDGNATREIPRQTMKVFKEIQQWQDFWFGMGCLLAGLAVAAGAFGAHVPQAAPFRRSAGRL